jgi:hypothetical protein
MIGIALPCRTPIVQAIGKFVPGPWQKAFFPKLVQHRTQNSPFALIQPRSVPYLPVSATFMPIRHSCRFSAVFSGILLCLSAASILQAQGA